MIAKDTVKDFVTSNGMGDSVICLHASFRSFGPVDAGPQTIIDGFLEAGCTLLCPSFYYASATFPPGDNYRRNGIDYTAIAELPEISFEDSPDQIDRSMGIIPRTLLDYAAVEREQNPHDCFCALGPQAAALLDNHTLLNVYSGYRNIYDNAMAAFVVLAGVDLTSCTPVHFAEEVAGRVLFRRWAIYHGSKVEVAVGSCSDGFERLTPVVGTLETSALLGDSCMRIFPFNAFIDVIAAEIRRNPTGTACANAGCLRCRDMAAGGRMA